MTRRQIKTLMDPKRDAFTDGAVRKQSAPPENSNPFAQSAAAPKPAGGDRPLVGDGIKEFFAPILGDSDGATYQPYLLREAEVHFTSTKAKTEGSRNVRFVNALQERGPDWETDAGFSGCVESASGSFPGMP